ncbi:hypothetical protein DESME_02870 [Desulfitobacterium metallireducens DSM 15288]|uniref:Uncharacterized protein n=1 Tax=Desulfitobacterium metallireducens DSM 15288 TaxID=871968 RepID=W0ECE1_9FIRM|nr:hypothetical protein DESME_02870 [Desulfitobacterium metallireducens DSM 15288]
MSLLWQSLLASMTLKQAVLLIKPCSPLLLPHKLNPKLLSNPVLRIHSAQIKGVQIVLIHNLIAAIPIPEIRLVNHLSDRLINPKVGFLIREVGDPDA